MMTTKYEDSIPTVVSALYIWLNLVLSIICRVLIQIAGFCSGEFGFLGGGGGVEQLGVLYLGRRVHS